MSFFKKLFGGKSDTLSQKDLLELFAQRIQALPNMKQVSIDASQNRVIYTTSNDSSGSSFIDNIWVEYQKNPEDLEPLLTFHTESLQQTLESNDKPIEESTRQIFPLIKHIEWLKTAQKQLLDMGSQKAKVERNFVYKTINEELLVTYVEDKANSMGFLSMDDADALGGIDQLHELAMKNLIEQKVPQVENQGAGGKYALRLDGFFDATIALVLSYFLPKMELQGRPLVAIPSRDELLICGDGLDEDIWSLLEITEEIFNQAPYQISSRLFRMSNEGALETVYFQRYEKDGQRLLSEVRTDASD